MSASGEQTSRASVPDWIGSNAITAMWLTALNALSGILAARALGVLGRGELAAIQVWATQLTPFALLGLSESLVYLVAKRREDAASLTATATVIGLVGSLVAGFGGLMLIPLTLGSSQRIVAAATTFLWAIPLSVIAGLAYCPLRAVGSFGVFNVLRAIQAAMWPAVLLLAWALNARDAVFVSRTYVAALFLVLILVVTTARLAFPGPVRIRLQEGRALLAYGLPALAATLPDAANSRLDQIFVAASWGAGPLGLYAVASTWSSAYGIVFSALVFVVVPSVAGLDSQAEQKATFLRLWRAGVLLACAMAVATAVAAPLAVPLLFGSDFAGASIPAVLLCLPSLLLALRQLLAAGCLALGRPRVLVKASVSALLVNLGLLWLLVPRSFVLGPAAAATIAHFIGAILLVRNLRVSMSARSLEFLPTSRDLAAITKIARRYTR